MDNVLYTNRKFGTSEIPLSTILNSTQNAKDLTTTKYNSLQLFKSGKPALLMNVKKEKREYKRKKHVWQFK